jgi:hypothetical protein
MNDAPKLTTGHRKVKMNIRQENKLALKRRIDRQKTFFASKEMGDLLIYCGGGTCPGFEGVAYPFAIEHSATELCQNDMINNIVNEYMKRFHELDEIRYSIDDDAIPTFCVHTGWGTLTESMTGYKAIFRDGMAWCNPNFDWNQIEHLKVNLDYPWMEFSLKCSQALWQHWDEDFFFLPTPHRSPLDAAEGIRGSAIYEDMYLQPEKVECLTNWCVDWIVAIENNFKDNLNSPNGWGRGIWQTYLPDGAIFVNGDPVDLVGAEMSRRFNQPSSGKLFATLGGGYFHHHALGLHLVEEVSYTKAMLVQQISSDLNCPSPVHFLLNDESMREKIITSSMRSPIALNVDMNADFDVLLSILIRGRFILHLSAGNEHDRDEAIAKVRRISNIK